MRRSTAFPEVMNESIGPDAPGWVGPACNETLVLFEVNLMSDDEQTNLLCCAKTFQHFRAKMRFVIRAVAAAAAA